jgi:aspartate/methionine/tyrosine aminotransferase
MALLSHNMARLGTENAFHVVPFIQQVEARGLRVIRCNIGEPDFSMPEHIRQELKRQIDAGNTKYCDPQGILPLRKAIADHLSAQGVPAAPERVVVFPGAKPTVGLTQHAYLDPGDEVIYPSPGFPIYESFTGYLGARPMPLFLRQESEFTFTGDDLAALITRRTKLLFLNFPSNPTGGVATRAQLEEIAEVVRTRLPPGARIMSDEIYQDIVFDGFVQQSIASLPGMAERTIVASGVSKSYAWTGGRVGWALLPTEEEAKAFRNLNINYFTCVSAYAQEAARVALESPLSKPAVRKMVDSFQHRRDVVVRALNAVDGVRCATPKGAFYVFPDVGGMCERLGIVAAHTALPPGRRARTTPATLLQMFLLLHHGVATLDRRSFGAIGGDRDHHLRISTATSLEDLEEAMRRIAQASRDAAGFAQFMRDPQGVW